MFPFAKLFIEIIDNSQAKRVRDLKFLPDLEHPLRTKVSSFAKGNILRCSRLQNDGSAYECSQVDEKTETYKCTE